MAFLTDKQIAAMGFKYIGKDVLISEKTSIYNPGNMSIGDGTRIDDFCVLSAGTGGVEIGRYVHIACYCSILGRGKVVLGDFVGISARTCIYSSNDDYSGSCFTVPTVPGKYRNVTDADVILEKHAIVGAGTVILPGVNIGVGASVGALSLIKEDCKEFGIYVGVPAKKIGDRNHDLLKLEQEFLTSLAKNKRQ
jgi:galactoside O-acetyltransferase